MSVRRSSTAGGALDDRRDQIVALASQRVLGAGAFPDCTCGMAPNHSSARGSSTATTTVRSGQWRGPTTLRPADVHDAAVIEDGHAIAEPLGFLHQ
jgi:hypothetical protein